MIFENYFVILVASVVGLSSSQLACPNCSNSCEPTGFAICDACICLPDFSSAEISCSEIVCPPGQECVSKSDPCPRKPCPVLPQCETTSATVSPVKIDDEKSSVNEIYDMLGISPGSDTDFGDFPFQFDPVKKSDDPVCKECIPFMCDSVFCSSHPTAKCVIENCTCVISFVDENGYPVDCTAMDNVPNTPASPTFPSKTNVPVSTVESKKPSGNFILIITLIISSILFLIILCGILYKLRRARISKTKKKKENDEEKAEVMKPLSENNNKHDEICANTPEKTSPS